MTRLLTILFAGLLSLPAHANHDANALPQGPVRKLLRAAGAAAQAKKGLDATTKGTKPADSPGVGAYVIGGLVLLGLLGAIGNKMGGDQ